MALLQDWMERLDRELLDLDEFKTYIRTKLDEVLNTGLEQFYTESYLSAGFSDTVGAAATSVELEFECPTGVLWEIRRISAIGTAAGTVALYLDGVGPGNLAELVTIGAAGKVAQGIDNYLYVPGGRKLIAVFESQANNEPVNLNLQIRQFRDRGGK